MLRTCPGAARSTGLDALLQKYLVETRYAHAPLEGKRVRLTDRQKTDRQNHTLIPIGIKKKPQSAKIAVYHPIVHRYR